MGKKFLILFFILIFISLISGLCNKGKININTATLKEIDKLSGVGPVKAQSILDSRPFKSINDLINVYGIGEKTLEKILNQGLACVEDEREQEIKEIAKKEIIPQEQNKKNNTLIKISNEKNKIKIINLNPKVIKSEDDKQELNKSDYAKYGFIGFCILLGILFMFKKNKNEFR